MSIVVLGLNHRSASVALRERFAFREEGIPSALRELCRLGLAQEAVILSTCNRVEVYVATNLPPPQAVDGLKKFLAAHHQYDGSLDDECYALNEPDSLEHLFKVAAGLDSMVLGETEIFGQLKRAYDLALRQKCTGACLNKAFQHAFHAAKHIRSGTNIQRGSISVSSVAVDLAEKIFNKLAKRAVMVIGAGEASERTARALHSRGASTIIVANRSFEKAALLAEQFQGRPIPFDNWTHEFQRIDIAISSTAAPYCLLDRAKLEPMMKQRRGRPLLLIDIAVPRDINPDVTPLEGVYLYNIDDLQSIAANSLSQRQQEVARCEFIIQEKVRAVLEKMIRGKTPGVHPPTRLRTASQ